jgi:hypothetical protein
MAGKYSVLHKLMLWCHWAEVTIIALGSVELFHFIFLI